MKNLVKAVLGVMADIETIDKSMVVGSSRNAYKATSDYDVRSKIRASLIKHELVLFPIEMNPKVKIERWEEDGKVKQSIFTSVEPEYVLAHSSGESIKVKGYGHGVDPQDKSAGKSTTYAMKNLLLNLFVVPTISMEDTDQTHSNEIEVPQIIGIAPSLIKVIKNADSTDALQKIWNNNKQLHENVEFLKLLMIKRIEFAFSKEDLTAIFNEAKPLHADSDFMDALAKRKKQVLNTK